VNLKRNYLIFFF